jgi:hypothetical protein
LQDRAAYAEILVDVSCRAHPAQALAAMAKGPGIQQRVERILADAPQRTLSLPLRFLVIACLAPLALAAADTHAEVAPIAVAMQNIAPAHAAPPPPQAAAHIAAAINPAKPAARHTAHRHSRVARDDEDAPSYDPRALLADSQTAVLPAVIPVSGPSKAKPAGSKHHAPVGAIYLAEPND